MRQTEPYVTNACEFICFSQVIKCLLRFLKLYLRNPPSHNGIPERNPYFSGLALEFLKF